MKLSIAAIALALAASANAQNTTQSAPFYLTLTSDDASVNGDTLSACHSGAATESLCLSNGASVSNPGGLAPQNFTFNVTTYQGSPPPSAYGQQGTLIFTLSTSTTPIPSTLDFYYEPTRNYALPLFYTGSLGTFLAFDSDNKLNVQGYVDFTKNPPIAGQTVGYYNWWSCRTYYEGYQYVNLVYALGSSVPETPGCSAVNVTRVFVQGLDELRRNEELDMN